MNQELLDHVKKNKEALSNALDVYNEDPSLLRNIICEQGVELTPSQLSGTVDIIRLALEINNNE